MSTYLRKLLITGGNGQLACALREHDMAHEFNVILCSRADMDITNPASIKHAMATYQPDLVINTAAYTAVDKAETESELAMLVNHIGAQHLAVACQKEKIPLIHVSTDYVFDGRKATAYVEDDEANPINIYGKSKWLGEQAVREQCEQHIILRVSGVFSEFGNNFLKTMLRLAQEKIELRIVADQFTCPTYAGDIAGAIYAIAAKPLIYGTFHYCGTPVTSWHQFALAIINEARKYKTMTVDEVTAITTEEYPTAAKRPSNSVLNCRKIAIEYGIELTSWKKTIQIIIQNILENIN